MNFFATQIANALKACGVASDQAQLAGAIIGAILTAVVLVVAAVAGSSAVEKIVEKMAPAIEAQLARVMETSLGKALIEVVETITEKIGLDELAASMTKGVGRLGKAIGIETEEDEMLMVNRLERGAVALGVGNQAVQTAGSIVVGLQEQAAMKTLAAVRMAMADIKALSTMIKEALETFAEHNKVLGQLMQEMSDASQAETAAGKLVLRNVRAV
jgi:invasin B